MQITAISDTHCQHDKITDLITEKDHILIHAGDAAHSRDSAKNEHEMINFLNWYSSLPAKWKIYVPGNHDVSVERGLINPNNWPVIRFLINRSIEIDGVKFFGSPYTPSFGNGWAWNMARHRIEYVWNGIPDDTDVLITHGPPKGIMDLTTDFGNSKELVQCGCAALRRKIDTIPSIKAHIFGHVHDQKEAVNNGVRTLNDLSAPIFVNASIVNLRTEVVNDPIRFGI